MKEAFNYQKDKKPVRIAVTGGSGFLGTNIIQFYIGKYIDIINIDKAPPKNKSHMKYWQKADILDSETLERAINNFSPTHLIHLAARTDLNEKQDINEYAANITGVRNIVEAINRYGRIKRAIFASTMLVCKRGYTPRDYDDYMPTTLYGESKAWGEKIVKDSSNASWEWVIIRPTSIWGPWCDEPYRNFFDVIIKGRYIDLGTRASTKTFGYIENTVYQIDRLLFFDGSDINHRVFYLGDYIPINISEFANEIAEALGKNSFNRVPLIIFKIAALVGDILQPMGFSKFPMSSFRLKNMIEDNIVDLSEIKKLTPSLPYSLEDGIKKTLEWLEAVK